MTVAATEAADKKPIEQESFMSCVQVTLDGAAGAAKLFMIWREPPASGPAAWIRTR